MPVDPQLLRQLEESIAADTAASSSKSQRLSPKQHASPEEEGDALFAVVRARSEVDAGANEAASEWGEAEAALSKALQAAKQRRRAEAEREALEGNLSPVQQPSGDVVIPDMERIGSLSRFPERKSPRSHLEQTSAALASEGRNEQAFGERARRMRTRAADAAKKMEDHAKRKLRVKITGILREVKRRQGLRHQQENARRFREQRYAQGFGPQPWVGDADEFALGLGEPNPEQEYLEDAATPRRRCIVESLSLEELAMVRVNPRWFIESGPSSGPGDADEDLDGFESLIDFFTPARKDKGLPIEVYLQNLRSRLAAASAEQSQQSVGDSTQRSSQQLSGGSSWQSLLGKRTASTSLSRSPTGLPQSSISRDDFLFASTTSYGSGISSQKREPIRDDKLSPTLLKVKEVFRRREENDAMLLEERQRSMEQRIARNAFKASEQQKELQSTQVQQKELHKVRMLEAKERVQSIEAEQQERMYSLKEQKMTRLRKALDKADDECEKKRDKATENLEEWRNGVIRAGQYRRQQERKAIREHKAREEAYVERLIKVGNDRANAEETQAQKNDKLKSRIQSSLVMQLEEKRRFECDCLAVALDEKLDAARYRRTTQLTKYKFLEKAFGEQVVFDPKYAFNAQRHGDEWKQKLQKSGGSASSPKF